MVDPHTNGCPEPEVLAAYVDRGLSLAERARVDAHLASCPQCIGLVAGVARTVADLSAHAPDAVVAVDANPRVTRRSLAGALAAAAAVIAVVAAPSLLRPWLERDAGLVSLVDSVGEQRSVLGRLTGGFPHAPLGVPSAGGQGGRAAGADRILLAADKIRESFGERETPSHLHALGVSQLLAGRYEDAAQSLLAASREQPANARYLSDVAAVQLERARLGLRPDDLPRALASADRARRLDPSLKEAWFNRALAASALSLTAEAKTGWTEYLKRDSVSPWAAEARLRLDELAKPTAAAAWAAIEGRLQQTFDAATAEEAVRTQTTEARNFIENTLLVGWANAVLGGEAGDVELEHLRVMSQAMLRVAGDALYADAVEAIDRATASSDRSLLALARAHAKYAEGSALFGSDRFGESVDPLTAARTAFESEGSPFADRAALDLWTISYVRGQSTEALQGLSNVREAAQRSHYSFHAARAAWISGLVTFAQSRLAETQANYEEMLKEFERMGDAEGAANAHNLLAVLHDYLGEAETAWRHRTEAFKGMAISRSPRFKYSLLAAAVPSIRVDSPETALSVQDAAVAIAQEWGREAAIADALAQRASLLASLGRDAEADEAIQAARIHLAKTADDSFRNRVEVAVLATESDLLRRRDPAAAVAAATRAIELVQQRRDHLRIAQLNLRLAQANIVWGRTEQARMALDRGLDAFNEERAASTDERPISALDESWQLFDASVQLSLKEKDYRRAFALADAARARSATESRRYGTPELAAIQSGLAPDEALIELTQFDTELAVWVIRHDRFDVVLRSMTRQHSQRLIARQQNEIWLGASTAAAGHSLFNEVVRPLSAYLKGARRLIFVPDATFEHASFGAFWNSANGHFLVEDVTLRIAPSAAAFAASGAALVRADTIGEPLIFNGSDPGTDGIDAIAAVYQSTRRLGGATATRERFFADAAGRAVVHLAARTSTNRHYPQLSRFVVTDDPGQPYSGAILGRDLAQRTLPRTGMVVIDEAGSIRSNRGEGTSGLARAFLTAGVPAVLGTLPGADENATRDLMIGFHREMSNGVSAEQALSTIQRNALQQNGRRLGAWTALVLYGSDR